MSTEFVEALRDLVGYLTVLEVNYSGTDFVSGYKKRIKELPQDPIEFTDILLDLRAELGSLLMKYPQTEAEVYPAVKVIDGIYKLASGV